MMVQPKCLSYRITILESSLQFFSYFMKNLPNDTFICGFQYLLHPNHTKFTNSSIMCHMIYPLHSTCCSLYKYMIVWDTCFPGKCKQGITIHGIITSLLPPPPPISGCSYEFQLQNINRGKPTPHILYPYMTPQTHQCSSSRVT